jgi:hypothetical protein
MSLSLIKGLVILAMATLLSLVAYDQVSLISTMLEQGVKFKGINSTLSNGGFLSNPILVQLLERREEDYDWNRYIASWVFVVALFIALTSYIEVKALDGNPLPKSVIENLLLCYFITTFNVIGPIVTELVLHVEDQGALLKEVLVQLDAVKQEDPEVFNAQSTEESLAAEPFEKKPFNWRQYRYVYIPAIVLYVLWRTTGGGD